MRPPYISSHALTRLRMPLPFLRNGSRRFLHNGSKGLDVAVIGGGITGLTAAYRLSKDPDCAKVTLYEKTPRLGGWIQSEKIKVDGGEIVFEYGPRTLRLAPPASYVLLDLLYELELDDEILFTSKDAPASQNRYIYYPDHLVRMPTRRKGDSLISTIAEVLRALITEPLFKTAAWSMLLEEHKAPLDIAPSDESIYDFVSRRLSPEVADNIVSSIYHGIFAGNIDRLSALALLNPLSRMERYKTSITTQIKKLRNEPDRIMEDTAALEMIRDLRNIEYRAFLKKVGANNSTLTLKNGVGQLADSLVAALKQSDKVDILTNAHVTHISQDPHNSDLTVKCENNKARTHNRLIATISPMALSNKLHNQSSDDNYMRSLRIQDASKSHDYATTTMVVNLYYPNPNLLPVRGFGYLIPRSIPFEQNPERALGVIFASEASIGQDTAPGTKLTVMMGGYYWDEWQESDYPSPDESIAMAQSLLKRHLGITDSPTVARARLQRDAIPQPTVGHLTRLDQLSRAYQDSFDGRITLAGAWYSLRGTGVVDCIRQGYLASGYYVKGNKPSIASHFYREFNFEGGITGVPAWSALIKEEDLMRRWWGL